MNKKTQEQVLKEVLTIYKHYADDIPTIKKRLEKYNQEIQKQKYVPLHRMEEGLKKAIQRTKELMEEAFESWRRVSRETWLEEGTEKAQGEFRKMIEEVFEENREASLTFENKEDPVRLDGIEQILLSKLGKNHSQQTKSRSSTELENDFVQRKENKTTDTPEDNVRSSGTSKGCGKMFCAIEGCNEIDESHTAYCVRHQRSTHMICGENWQCQSCKKKTGICKNCGTPKDCHAKNKKDIGKGFFVDCKKFQEDKLK